LCPQATLTPDVFAEQLHPLMNRDTLLAMAEKSRLQAKPCATAVVVEAIVSL
jgi:UDP-N-acetylglucosamine:LPS N-acetylglucosamine transferase